jgi:hypothetical protein
MRLRALKSIYFIFGFVRFFSFVLGRKSCRGRYRPRQGALKIPCSWPKSQNKSPAAHEKCPVADQKSLKLPPKKSPPAAARPLFWPKMGCIRPFFRPPARDTVVEILQLRGCGRCYSSASRYCPKSTDARYKNDVLIKCFLGVSDTIWRA